MPRRRRPRRERAETYVATCWPPSGSGCLPDRWSAPARNAFGAPPEEATTCDEHHGKPAQSRAGPAPPRSTREFNQAAAIGLRGEIASFLRRLEAVQAE